MKILISLTSLLFLFISDGNANDWTLVWSDEFNYSGQPDPSKWQHEEGLVRNDEIGYFTSRTKNVRVGGGVLVIEAHKEAYANANYTTGSITTRDKKSFKYGRFEVRAKMPYGKGSHVAIWLDGINLPKVGWPTCGEIDVAEYVGRLPDTIHLYNHYADPANPKKNAKTVVGKPAVLAPYNSFHIYAMEWDEKQIKYFIDNTQVATFNVSIAGTESDNPFRKEHVFHLTYSLGGWGWGVNDRLLPEKFEIDYIRIYKDTTSMIPINLLLLK